eukprot:TRINITY_DN1397_c1_g1_i1.p1 TRINITY_DN1397_c1_g1~~TRINITY_DN1397_c1_g1_i1.p1  ORF type:complete len:252 (+),score=62.62 TRINITY_DN1397_c1_g1_i1:45-800(+)
MSIHRSATEGANLFAQGSAKDWNREIADRSGWSQKLKTVEAAKDKHEGLKARTKGKRGGDGSKGNYSTFGFETEPQPESTQRSARPYSYKPGERNPLMAGIMKPEDYRPGVKKVLPPKEKKQPKTHKVVNTQARDGNLRSKTPGDAFAILAGAGEPTVVELKGRKCFGNFNAETQPPPQRPSGRGGRKTLEQTDPWKYEKVTENVPDYNTKFHQRYNCTPAGARRTHTFEVEAKGPRYPNYRLNPPYSVEA